MGLISWSNERAKRIDNIYDLKLVGFMSFVLAFVCAKLFPALLSLNIWWYVLIFIVVSIRPMYVFLKKI